LRFHYADWPRHLLHLIGGLEVTRFLHRSFAVLTFGYASYHLGSLLWAIIFKKQRRLLYGPTSMVPRLKDFKDLLHQFRWFFYLGKPAKVDRWTYWEKFDYFAVFWGIPVIGFSGLMLWFPRFFTSIFPGYILNVAKIVHSEEALLAVGFIFVFHFFHTHLRPEAFPMDLVMFTGRIPLERFKKERPEEYERLEKSGELEKYLTGPPTRRQKLIGYIGGTLGLSVGIFLIIQIVFSVLKY
jgi:cytochrome b subunit of formate dehydrogenase